MWSTAKYAQLSELSEQKLKGRISTKGKNAWFENTKRNKQKTWMQVMPAERHKESCKRHSKEFRNQNGEHLVNLCEAKGLETSHTA